VKKDVPSVKDICTDYRHYYKNIMLEQLKEDIETEIKKWFPDEVKENER